MYWSHSNIVIFLCFPGPKTICLDIREKSLGKNIQDGFYNISILSDSTAVSVFCDMNTDGGKVFFESKTTFGFPQLVKPSMFKGRVQILFES